MASDERVSWRDRLRKLFPKREKRAYHSTSGAGARVGDI